MERYRDEVVSLQTPDLYDLKSKSVCQNGASGLDPLPAKMLPQTFDGVVVSVWLKVGEIALFCY